MRYSDPVPQNVLVFAIALCVGLLSLPVQSLEAQGFQWPDRMENAQVLPDTLSGRELGRIMRSYTRALGVRCEYCHVGESGQSLAEFDFVSDDNAAKEISRSMIRMVAAINSDYVGELDRDAVIAVTCETCHRGVRTPMPLHDVLANVQTQSGTPATIARYRELRESYHGSAAYDFTEGTLTGLGQTFAEKGLIEAAIAMYRLNLEFFPESGATWTLLGQSLVEVGELEAGAAALEEALDFVTNPRARARVEAMLDGIDVDNDQN